MSDRSVSDVISLTTFLTSATAIINETKMDETKKKNLINKFNSWSEKCIKYCIEHGQIESSIKLRVEEEKRVLEGEKRELEQQKRQLEFEQKQQKKTIGREIKLRVEEEKRVLEGEKRELEKQKRQLEFEIEKQNREIQQQMLQITELEGVNAQLKKTIGRENERKRRKVMFDFFHN